MTKLTLTFVLLLAAAAAAHAQGTTPAGTPYPSGSSPIYPKLDPDVVRRDEAHIAANRAATRDAEARAATLGRTSGQTFKAEIKVTNTSVKAIQSVSWTATLLDPFTGAVIRAYDVETETQIAPGKTKKLSEKLPKPGPRTVSATSLGGTAADLKVRINTITYVDGTTSTTP